MLEASMKRMFLKGDAPEVGKCPRPRINRPVFVYEWGIYTKRPGVRTMKFQRHSNYLGGVQSLRKKM